MPAAELILSFLAPCLSAASAGLFLRLEKRPAALSALTAIAAGGGAALVVPDELSLAAGLAAGLPLAALCAALLGKLQFPDALLYYLVGACYLALWSVFWPAAGLTGGDAPVLCIFGIFFLLHCPAVLLSFPAFSIPPEKRMRLRRSSAEGRALSMTRLALAGAALLLILAAAFRLIPVSGAAAFAARAAAAAALFWAGLAVMVLLAAYDQKREQSSAEGVYHDDMAAFMNVVRSQRHDYNLHVQTVAGLIAQDKWDECREYVDSLVRDTARLNAILPVKEPAVAALIGYYSDLAERDGFTLLVDVRDDLEAIRTNTYETNKIIGNLLQNAFDELSLQRDGGDGRIELSIFKRGEACIIRVSNRVLSPEAFSGGSEPLFRQGYTTKRGHDGVGLSSIRVLARKAGGDVTAWLEKDTVHFVASIPMNSAGCAVGN